MEGGIRPQMETVPTFRHERLSGKAKNVNLLNLQRKCTVWQKEGWRRCGFTASTVPQMPQLGHSIAQKAHFSEFIDF
jgi:hypothetical protein